MKNENTSSGPSSKEGSGTSAGGNSTKPHKQSMRSSLRFTWQYIRVHQKHLYLAFACQMVTVLMKVVVPIMGARVIVALVNNSVMQILYSALLLMAVNIVTDFFSMACNRLYNVVYNKTLTTLESSLVENVLRLTNQCLDNKGSGLFVQRLTVDTSQLATGFNSLADLLSQMVTFIGILGAILITSPPVFLFVALLLTVQVVLEMIRMKILTADDRTFRNANEKYTGFVGEMVKGAKDVKLMHREDAFEKALLVRIEQANNTRMKRDARSWKYKLIRWEIGRAGGFLFAALLAWLLYRSVLAPAIAVVLYNYYSNLGNNFILMLGQLLEFIRDFNLSNERVMELVYGEDFPKEEFGTRHIDQMQGDVRYEHVCFHYSDPDHGNSRLILNDMSFHVRPGETVALVGRSGCGKSTAFHLVSRLYTATSGRVLLDGIDIRELDQDTVRCNVDVVSQYPYLFHLSIRDNLRMAKPDLTDEEMHRVCALACMDQDVERMPAGYDSIIGEGGMTLSGGQRQRIAIARSLLKDSRILILDEATSALDNQTQAEIQDALANIRGDRTILVIAHRLSTVINADRIMYMEDGRILDEGTHTELLERCEPYRQLYTAS